MKLIKYITRSQLEAWEPCSKYTPERIDELADGRKSIAVRSVLDLPIPDEDKIWLLCHEGILPDETFRSLARRFALRVIHLTGDESLKDAADASASASWAAASARAACASAMDAWDAARDARDAAAEWQLEQFRAALEGE